MLNGGLLLPSDKGVAQEGLVETLARRAFTKDNGVVTGTWWNQGLIIIESVGILRGRGIKIAAQA
jgi:hypothetical protein